MKLNPDKAEVLLVNEKADQGRGMQPVLGGILLPLKTGAQFWGAPGFVSEPGCPGCGGGKESFCARVVACSWRSVVR